MYAIPQLHDKEQCAVELGSVVLDREKMLEQCQRDTVMIQSEFQMLERTDFVDFIQGPKANSKNESYQPNSVKFKVANKNYTENPEEESKFCVVK